MLKRAEWTLGRVLEEMYVFERPVSKGAARQLEISIKLFEEWASCPKLGELGETLVSRWLTEYATTVAPSTARGKRTAILAVWGYAADVGLCEQPIRRRVRRIRVPRRVPECWTLEELDALCKAAAEIPGYCAHTGIKWSLFWDAFARTAYDTALRLSDVLAIHRDSIRAGRLTVYQQKTGQAQLVRFRQATLTAIDATFPPERELIFPWEWCETTFFDRFRALVKSAGLKGTSKFIRRSSASYYERDNPGGARAHLGHSSPDMWQFYVNPGIAFADRPLPEAFD